MTTTLTDPRPVLRSAFGTAASLMDGIRPDQLDGPTPCDDFRVRDLPEHLVGVVKTAARVGRGENPFDPPEAGAKGVTFADAVAEWEAAWADDAALSRPSPLPWAPESGAAALRSWVLELTVHSWDLARATGQDPAWDPSALALAAEYVEQDQFMPATGRHDLFDQMRGGADFPDPFLDAVPVPDDAPVLDRIVAWTGRDPGWMPS